MKYLFLLLFCSVCVADEVGIRFGTAVSTEDSGVIQFPHEEGNVRGKTVSTVYDWEPNDNLYIEGAVGYRSSSDVFEFDSLVYELSPGVRVGWGPLVLKLSEGVSYMPSNSYNPVTTSGYQQIDFVTHLQIGLKDPRSGVGIYFDRAHYSNGFKENNPSLNYTGFVVEVSL